VSFELAEVEVRRGARCVLDAVSMTLRPGRVVAVLGPNGAGKSTALAVFAGDLAPSAGSARLDGTPLGSIDRRQLARRRAVLLQQSRVVFDHTALELVCLGRLALDGSALRATDERVALEALARFGVLALAGRSVLGLSGGELQRVQLARAMAQIDGDGGEASYLLLDEPSNSLDLAEQLRLLALLRGEAERGVGVLVVLHDVNHAAWLADDVVLLREGRVVAAGPTREVLTADAVRQTFGVELVVVEDPRIGRPLIAPVAPVALGRRS
jgi:iron complex transport system ATP-binding protein